MGVMFACVDCVCVMCRRRLCAVCLRVHRLTLQAPHSARLCKMLDPHRWAADSLSCWHACRVEYRRLSLSLFSASLSQSQTPLAYTTCLPHHLRLTPSAPAYTTTSGLHHLLRLTPPAPAYTTSTTITSAPCTSVFTSQPTTPLSTRSPQSHQHLQGKMIQMSSEWSNSHGLKQAHVGIIIVLVLCYVLCVCMCMFFDNVLCVFVC